MLNKAPLRLRPDAWMDWTDFELDPDDRWQPMLVVRQGDSRIHLTPLLAAEMIAALTEWLLPSRPHPRSRGEMMARFRNEYKYAPRFGHPEHIWTCTGSLGAMHFHVTDLGEEYEGRNGIRYSAGLEIHSRAPLSDSPPHEKCWLIGGPCWHDGTSLYAEERLVPFWRQEPDNHERMFRMLEREYEARFIEDRARSEAADG